VNTEIEEIGESGEEEERKPAMHFIRHLCTLSSLFNLCVHRSSVFACDGVTKKRAFPAPPPHFGELAEVRESEHALC
jgi:hypothetical protein